MHVFILQVSIVGDFSEQEIESCIIDYLGTIRATRDSDREQGFSPVLFRPSPSDLQSQQVRIKANFTLNLQLFTVRNWNARNAYVVQCHQGCK